MPSVNPLWFGYYPGDRPMTKRPDRRFPTSQLDMSDVGLNAALDEAINAVGKPAELPNQLWEWIQGDWKYQFNIAASPYQQKGNELYAYDSSEAADVPGAYMQINLVDLAEDPKKTASKFIEKSVHIINPFYGLLTAEGEFWTDLDTSRERAMWKELLKYDPTSPTPDPLTLGIVRKAFVDSAGNPIKLNGNNIMQGDGKVQLSAGATVPAGVTTTAASVAEKDVYKDVSENVMGFVAGKKSAFSRNGAYSGLQTSFINAAAVELSQKKTAIDTALAGQPTLTALDAKIDSLVRENELIDKLGKFKKNPAEEGLDDIKTTLAKVGFTQSVPIASVQANLTSLQARISDPTSGIQAHISTIRAGLAGPERARFNNDVKELEAVLDDALDLCTKYTAPGITSLSRVEAEKLLQDITQVSSRFSNNRYSGGAYDRFVQSVSRRYFEGPDSLLLVNPLNSTGNQIMSDGYRSLGTLYSHQKRVYLQADGRDLLDAVFSSKGDLEKSYIWFGQIRDRIQMFTPGYWTGKVIERTHGFGLVYKGDDVVPIHPAFDRSPLIRTHTFKESFDVTLGGATTKVTGKFTGGKHLESFYKAWDRAKDGKLVGVARGTGVAYSTNPDLHTQALFDAINGNTVNVGTLGAGMNYVVGGTKDMPNMVAEWDKFRKALEHSGIPFQFDASGNLINNTHNKALLDGLFKRIGLRKVNAANIDPFVGRIGTLQIYASWLSIIQQKMFTKFGKFIDPWVHLRTAAAKKVGDFAAKILSKIALRVGLTALGAATAGIATALAPIIEKVLQAVVARTIDKAKVLVRAVLKGDFSGELNKMMDDAMRATEKVITCGCFVPLFLAFAGFMLMANIIVSISPVDRAKQAISAVGDAILGPPVTPPPGSTASGSFYRDTCNGPTICGSFRGGTGCHGTDSYWGTYANACQWNIPTASIYGRFGLRGTDSPGFFCSKPRINLFPPWEINDLNSGPKYGFAADYAPTTTCSGETTVYAPSVSTDPGVMAWDYVSSFSSGNGTGWGAIFRSVGGTNTYTMLILHLQRTVWSATQYNPVQVGEAVGVLFPHPNGPHVHIELKRGSEVVEPEFVL